MTEMELRQKLVSTAKAYDSCKESNGSHKKIIDIYNAHRPLAVGYEVKYTDAWCSTYVSAMSILCGLTDILPTECGCGRHIDLFKALDSWIEDDTYVPKIGDVVFYNWNDSGIGDCTTGASHVGIVTSCDGKSITVIEGNISNAVGYRTIAVGGRYIRGYGVPKYETHARKEGNEMRYYYLKEVPKVYREETLDRLIDLGFIKGKGGIGEDLIIDLGEDVIRLMIYHDRMGLYPQK